MSNDNKKSVEFHIALNEQLTVLSVSDRIETMLGFSTEDFISSRVSLKDRIHKDDTDIVDLLFTPKTQFDSGTVNFRIRQAKGQILCVKGLYKKHMDDEKNYIILELSIYDARTLSRTMDDATSTPAFQAIMESTDDYIYFKDRNHVFTGASQTLVALCHPAEHWTDLLGLTDYDVFPEEYADIYYRLEKDIFSGIHIAHEIQETLTKDGIKGWIDNRKYPIKNDNNEIIGLFGIARDITEQKLTERSKLRFQRVLEGSLNEIYMFDPQSNYFIDVNLGARQNLGFSMKELKMMTPIDIKPEIDTESFNKMLEPLRTGIKQKIQFETIHQRKDGTQYNVEVHLQLIEEDEPVFLAIILDITNRLRSEEELIKSRKLESIGLLAGGLAHDFNNILTGLFGNIELAKMKLPNDHAAYSYIQNANQALERATDLTKQLLTFAKGGEPLLEMIDIGQVINDSVNLSLSGSNVKTTLNLADDLWHIKADKGQLSQVITNMCINAVQAMPVGGELIIEAKNIKDIDDSIAPPLSGDVVKISICDEGLGISEKHLDRIYDPYFTTKQMGSGLGLATVHSIINKHNGHLSVDSELGVGTTFNILLPADRSKLQTTEITTSGMIGKSEPMSGHILVMDDEEMILNLSVEMIKSFGYTVDTAVDGKEAIEKYISAEKGGKAFDIVIMDLTIPGGMGGKEALQELLSINPQIKAIVASGYSTDSAMANYNDYGFKGRLVKPFQMVELQMVLSRLIKEE